MFRSTKFTKLCTRIHPATVIFKNRVAIAGKGFHTLMLCSLLLGPTITSAGFNGTSGRIGIQETTAMAAAITNVLMDSSRFLDLDTCGCNKLKTEYMEYEAWQLAGFSPAKPPIPAGVSFEDYLKYTTGVSSQNAGKLQTLCEELFYKGVARDKNNAAVREYNPNKPSGWWSKTAQSNLKQKVQDFKISDTLKIPASWSCDPDWTPPPPCNKTLSPCLMNQSLKLALPGMLGDLVGGGTRRSLLGMGSFGYDEMLAELLTWTDQYHQYLAGNTNPPRGVDLERVLFLRDLFTRLNAYYLENTCPGDRPATVDLEFLLKLMLGCGSGGYNFNFNPPCITTPDCQAFAARVKALMATVSWPGYSAPYDTANAKYAFDFSNWYNEYLLRKAAGTATPAENDWAAALEADLNAQFNTCYPDKTFGLSWFMSRLSMCMPVPKGTAPACDTCYTANQQWLDALQVFLSDLTKKQEPDELTDFSYFLKPSPGLLPSTYLNSFFNSMLYQGGSDEENLTWTLNENYQGGSLMPGLRTLIKDNNGFKLDLSIDWPGSEARWNFAEIEKFINIRPIKVKNCNTPKYLLIDAIYNLPDDYTMADNIYGYGLNYPPPPNSPKYCYDTITLIGKIWESSNGLGVGKPVDCHMQGKAIRANPSSIPALSEDSLKYFIYSSHQIFESIPNDSFLISGTGISFTKGLKSQKRISEIEDTNGFFWPYIKEGNLPAELKNNSFSKSKLGLKIGNGQYLAFDIEPLLPGKLRKQIVHATGNLPMPYQPSAYISNMKHNRIAVFKVKNRNWYFILVDELL